MSLKRIVTLVAGLCMLASVAIGPMGVGAQLSPHTTADNSLPPVAAQSTFSPSL